MKLLLLAAFCLITMMVTGQEIEHKHSVHYAFIENKGQWDDHILFKSKFNGGNLWVEQGKLLFHLQDFSEYRNAHANLKKDIGEINCRQRVVNIIFENSNTIHSVEKGTPYNHYYNYFIGNNSSRWTSDVKAYSQATLKDLYNGIDLKLIEEEEQLKYEFHVKPHTSPSQISLLVDGQEDLYVDKKGDLVIKTLLGEIKEKKPYAYQIINGKIIDVPCNFEVTKNKVHFALGKYNKEYELVIDPILVFATYSGSVTDNFGMTATYAYDGGAFSGGTIFGNAYPTPDPNAYNTSSVFTQPTYNFNGVATDVFISKYSSDGSTMLWTSFYGGGTYNNGAETVHSLICDQSNNLYMFGATSSTDLPIQNGFQTTHGGGTPLNITYNGTYFGNQGVDMYVAKFSADGHQLLGSTYVGGDGNDGVNTNSFGGNYGTGSSYDSLTSNYGDQFRGEIMLDQLGNILVASSTKSTNFPVLNAIQPTKNGLQDGVIFKLKNDLSGLIFSTYIGGSNNDACYSVKIDSSYNIVFAGGTSSNDLPMTPGVWQPTYNGGKTDGFVGKMAPDGSTILAMSYIGTGNMDQVHFAEIDRSDNIFLLGVSRGGGFPVINSGYSNPNSGQFIMKLNSSLTTVEHSTVFGNGNGQVNLSPAAFLVDFCGNIYVSGWGGNFLIGTALNGMPVTQDAFRPTPPNGYDFYLAVLNRNFNNLLYGTYIGGSSANEHVDGGTSRFDKNGVIFQSVCGGCGGFSDFPTSPNAWSRNNLSTNCNNILFKFDFQITPHAEFTTDVVDGCAPLKITFNNTSSSSDRYVWDFGNGHLDSTTYNPTYTYNVPGTYTVKLFITDSICEITDSALITIHVFDSLLIDLPDTLTLCVPSEITIKGNTYGTATSFLWASDRNFTNIINTSPTDSTLTITPPGPVTYYFKAANAFCERIDSVIVTFKASGVKIRGVNGICYGESTLLTVENSNPLVQFTYQWSPQSAIVHQNSPTSVTVSPDSSMYIYLTASTPDGCYATDSIYINVSQLTTYSIEATADHYTVMTGETTTLHGSPDGYSYLWSPPKGLSSVTAQHPSATVHETTIYLLTVSDPFCQKSDTVQIIVLPYVCDNPFVFVPNAFSPNGDGENDILYVRSRIVQDIIFRVFNRWGEMVFESTSMSSGWDGSFKGRKCDPDVYDYYLKVICVDGQENIIKGNVTLLK